MSVRAPGKLFASGAYAVLAGAPAIVLAVDRYVEASIDANGSDRPEVLAVAKLLNANAPRVDTHALEQDGRKLGLGSSAAAAVASVGAILASRGEDLLDRKRVIDLARRAHRQVQPRGSGGDIAASTLGGAVSVRLEGDALIADRFELRNVVFRAFALDRALRTSDALDRLAAKSAHEETKRAMAELTEAANAGARAFVEGNAHDAVLAAHAHVDGLRTLSRALDLPLVPPEIDRARNVLGSASMSKSNADFALLPSGAGGGDTVLWLAGRAPTSSEVEALERSGLVALDLALDLHGLHLESKSN